MTDIMQENLIQNPCLRLLGENKKSMLLLLLFFNMGFLFSQSKSYFDKGGKSSDENGGYYYREKTQEPNSYKSHFVNGGGLYFEGKIDKANDADENLNVYSGTCIWYFKNGSKKAVRSFDKDGLESGTSFTYYESGKPWKETDFVKGRANSTCKEYEEDGRLSRIFEDDFKDNTNDWDLYNSDKTAAAVQGGCLELTSFTPAGASRYISHPIESDGYAIEAIINRTREKDEIKAGLIFGFKDWQNYSFFLITATNYYIGSVSEGISSLKVDGEISNDIQKSVSNNLKVLCTGEKCLYSINGNVQFTAEKSKLFGSKVGFAVSGKSTLKAEKLVIKEIGYKVAKPAMVLPANYDVKSTGSGLIFSRSGYVLTNFHVVKNSNKIVLQVMSGGMVKNYNAAVVQKDIEDDLAILQIQDSAFKPLEPIKYAFRENGGLDVGTNVFTLGYPYSISEIGLPAKFSDGKVSSKTGYNNAVNACQTSIAVRPGSSGGPLFDEKGQFSGLIMSEVSGSDNASYAIKLSYVKNLVDLLPDANEFPKDQSLSGLSQEEKIKILSNYVVLIKIK